MSKEYSIYFDKRKIVLTKSLDIHFNNQNGLFIRFDTFQELSKILDFFQSTTEVENVFISAKNIRSLLEAILTKYKVITAAGGLVQNGNGEYLFIFRYGKWDLPKGKLESGEKVEEAALREVSEETGISGLTLKSHIVNTYHTYRLGQSFILKETHWFHMKYEGHEPLIPQLTEDISMVKWVAVSNFDEILCNTYNTIYEVLNTAKLI